MQPPFRPLCLTGGYLPIEDHGLIGDGDTAALIGRDGAVCWMCVPRFDSEPLFCRILDARKGGAFTVSPEGLVESRQFYEDDTAVLVTEMRTAEGMLRISDALTLRSGADLNEDVSAARHELIRTVEALSGTIRLRAEIVPYGGASAEVAGDGIRLRCLARPGLELHLRVDGPVPCGLRSEFELRARQRVHFVLRWDVHWRRGLPRDPIDAVHDTGECWRRWVRQVEYDGPQKTLVRRSAITLKLLDYFDNGSIVAAPTSSLPEEIGGARNWDYRYAWVRDCAFSVYALHRIGLYQQARGFLGWVLEAVERGERAAVLYSLDGHPPPPERDDAALEGYRASRPVRWGNAAADQVQNDVYGEIVDCAYQWSGRHGGIEPSLWQELRKLIDRASRVWRTPDRGIWEVRTASRPFTYSAALCWVAVDRGRRLAELYNLPGDRDEWQREAERIRRAVIEEAWNPQARVIAQQLGGSEVDASSLALPLRRLLPANDPRMIATTQTVRERLGAGGGLIYRYRQDESPDGVPGGEGAFLLCSFWLADNLALQGRLEEAGDLFDSLCSRANGAGLLPEQIDPSNGAFLGNFPQAFSHVGLISTGVTLARGRRLTEYHA